jgi:hypothetical protein
MKGYRMSGGWLYKCHGGPLDQQHIRGYNQEKVGGKWVETELDWEFTIKDQPGRYILEPLLNGNGTRKQAKHKGIETDAFKYVWEEPT